MDRFISAWASKNRAKTQKGLGDLWGCYEEWSAYCAGTPVLLDNSENVVQYYFPSLSAIQIYTNKSATFTNPREDIAVVEFEDECRSDDSENEKFSRTLSNNSSRTWDATSVDSVIDHEGSWPIRDRLGYLHFQYIDMYSPYVRIPLMDKINELAQNYPGLMTLKNVDLSPASWLAVAWYPNYNIPDKVAVKELGTCFLTYHALSSSFQETEDENDDKDIGRCFSRSKEKEKGKRRSKDVRITPLPPFGLATYRMEGELWVKPNTHDYEKLIDLYSAAKSWLKQLNVQHHDFNFFTTHSTIDFDKHI
ncbi:unnamed protein product [Ilex paraguariensis]|uniref:Uncharacterized protein n=1 Tax=Ilex paraguariensis TaxID=185542 RepID=A0ABC8T4V5_9AQUA